MQMRDQAGAPITALKQHQVNDQYHDVGKRHDLNNIQVSTMVVACWALSFFPTLYLHCIHNPPRLPCNK